MHPFSLFGFDHEGLNREHRLMNEGNVHEDAIDELRYQNVKLTAENSALTKEVRSQAEALEKTNTAIAELTKRVDSLSQCKATHYPCPQPELQDCCTPARVTCRRSTPVPDGATKRHSRNGIVTLLRYNAGTYEDGTVVGWETVGTTTMADVVRETQQQQSYQRQRIADERASNNARLRLVRTWHQRRDPTLSYFRDGNALNREQRYQSGTTWADVAIADKLRASGGTAIPTSASGIYIDNPALRKSGKSAMQEKIKNVRSDQMEDEILFDGKFHHLDGDPSAQDAWNDFTYSRNLGVMDPAARYGALALLRTRLETIDANNKRMAAFEGGNAYQEGTSLKTHTVYLANDPDKQIVITTPKNKYGRVEKIILSPHKTAFLQSDFDAVQAKKWGIQCTVDRMSKSMAMGADVHFMQPGTFIVNGETVVVEPKKESPAPEAPSPAPDTLPSTPPEPVKPSTPVPPAPNISTEPTPEPPALVIPPFPETTPYDADPAPSDVPVPAPKDPEAPTTPVSQIPEISTETNTPAGDLGTATIQNLPQGFANALKGNMSEKVQKLFENALKVLDDFKAKNKAPEKASEPETKKEDERQKELAEAASLVEKQEFKAKDIPLLRKYFDTVSNLPPDRLLHVIYVIDQSPALKVENFGTIYTQRLLTANYRKDISVLLQYLISSKEIPPQLKNTDDLSDLVLELCKKENTGTAYYLGSRCMKRVGDKARAIAYLRMGFSKFTDVSCGIELFKELKDIEEHPLHYLNTVEQNANQDEKKVIDKLRTEYEAKKMTDVQSDPTVPDFVPAPPPEEDLGPISRPPPTDPGTEPEERSQQ